MSDKLTPDEASDTQWFLVSADQLEVFYDELGVDPSGYDVSAAIKPVNCPVVVMPDGTIHQAEYAGARIDQ